MRPDITYREIWCPRCNQRYQVPDPASLKLVREAAGLTLREMQQETGFSASYLSAVERGGKAVSPRVLAAYQLVREGTGGGGC